MARKKRAGQRRFGWFASLRVSTKLMIGVAAVTVLMAAQGLYTLRLVDGVQQEYEDSYDRTTLTMTALAELRSALGQAQALMIEQRSTAPDDASRPALEAQRRSADARLDARLRELEQLLGAGPSPALANLKRAWARHRTTTERTVPAPEGAPPGDSFRPVLAAADQLFSEQRSESRARLETDKRGVATQRHAVTTGLLLGIVLAALIVGAMARMIVRPIGEAVQVLEEVAAGDLTRRVQVHSGDEIGRMGSALNLTLDRIEDAFEGIGSRASALATAADEFHGVSDRLAGTVQDASSKASVATASAELVNHNVESAAAATEQLNSSVREIARNAADAARVATDAVGLAADTNATVAKLGQSSAEIGKVLKVITSVAQQTKLLALNATIEAASAGAAGKGFAVVANEVKELAKETAKATDEISRKIETIQLDTQGAVKAIEKISVVIGKISETQKSIAAAVEGQTATSGKISRNVGEAASVSAEIAHQVALVAERVVSTTTGANNTRRAANELALMASDLQQLLGQFKHRSHGPDDRGAASAALRIATSRGTELRQALPEEQHETASARNGAGRPLMGA